MKKIYKYQLKLTDSQSVFLPVGYKILSAQIQVDQLCMWAMIDPYIADMVPVEIKVFGTGFDIDGDCGDFIDTVQLTNSGLVLHVFALGVAL